jgi:asparagine N-glycosylation enzyme membrane subunit Stt3
LPHNLLETDPGAASCAQDKTGGSTVMGLILLVILIILLLGAVPAWPYSRNWGYGPSGGLGLLVLIVIILLVLRVF